MYDYDSNELLNIKKIRESGLYPSFTEDNKPVFYVTRGNHKGIHKHICPNCANNFADLGKKQKDLHYIIGWGYLYKWLPEQYHVHDWYLYDRYLITSCACFYNNVVTFFRFELDRELDKCECCGELLEFTVDVNFIRELNEVMSDSSNISNTWLKNAWNDHGPEI
jgi:hypothetical protein